MWEKYLLDISMFDVSFLEKCVASRMADLSINTIPDYLVYLDGNVSEPVILFDSLNNSYSEFFRNPLTFLVLEQNILPNIFNRKKSGQNSEMRIWSAGCAAGQEPYSLSIMAEDFKANNNQDVSVRIFATDKNEQELQKARKGIFHFRSVQNTRLIQIKKYFSNSGEYYSINDEIKKNVDFSIFDLIDEGKGAPPSSIYGDFDIVMCSNLLFYYKPEMQKRILARLSNSLVNGGYLVTGEAEVAIVKSYRGFKQYGAPAAIFTKTG